MRDRLHAPILREVEAAIWRTGLQIAEHKRDKSRVDRLEAAQDRNIAELMAICDPEIYRILDRCEMDMREVASRLVREGKRQWARGESMGYERGRRESIVRRGPGMATPNWEVRRSA